MAPTWFGPPNAHHHQMMQPGGVPHYHPPSGQRMSSITGETSPHSFHTRNSPPMRGGYPGGHAEGPRPPPPPPPPHGVVGHHPPRMPPQGGHFPVQHPQAMTAGHRQGHSSHTLSRHHAPSPAMARRIPVPPPNAMRPIPQQAGSGGGSRPPSFEQQRAHAAMHHHHPQQGHGHHHPRSMHHPQMMRYQQEHHHHHQQPYMHHQQRANYHHHYHLNALSEHHEMIRHASMEHEKHHPHHYQQPETPEQQTSNDTPDQQPTPNGTHSRSPSPPVIPPPPLQYQQKHNMKEDPAEVSQRPSPASLPGSEFTSMEPQHHMAAGPWNPGMGPLRESRLQNMPQKHMMMPQHPHHPHAQRPIPQQHRRAAGLMPQHHQPYVNENMERFRAMEQQKRMGAHHMKPIHPYHQHPAHHPMVGVVSSRSAVPSPGHHPQPSEQQQRPQMKQAAGTKKGPDVTMDAASMLLALRTSASPSTVSAATLEEQPSKDQSETSKKTAMADQQEHDDLEDDDVPALASSSSSLSAPSHKPQIQHHEVPKNFPTRLALPNDEAKLNSLHCFLRSELLEIFVVERSANKSPTHSPGSSVGRVGLRCVFCAMARKRNAAAAEHDTIATSQQQQCDEAPMAVFYPKSIAEIYRLVTSWQRCHLRKCRSLPPNIRSKWTLLRENDKSRGKTHYWITSAKEIGLVDCQSRAGGIRFASPRSGSEASGSIATYGADSISDSLHGLGNDDQFQSLALSYRPRSNPNFPQGPSQKQREAVSSDLSPAPISTFESPMKSEFQESKPSVGAPSGPSVEEDSKMIPADTTADDTDSKMDSAVPQDTLDSKMHDAVDTEGNRDSAAPQDALDSKMHNAVDTESKMDAAATDPQDTLDSKMHNAVDTESKMDAAATGPQDTLDNKVVPATSDHDAVDTESNRDSTVSKDTLDSKMMPATSEHEAVDTESSTDAADPQDNLGFAVAV